MIPDNVALGTDDCLKRCGITRPEPPATSQRQPRIAGNAYPSGFPLSASAPIPTPTFLASSAAASSTAKATSD